MDRFNRAEIEPADREKLEAFFRALRREGLAKNTVTWYVNYTTRMYQTLKTIGYDKPLQDFDHEDLERLLFYVEDVKKLSAGSLWNYKKLIKKLMRWMHNDEPPKWVRDLKLNKEDSPVQPSDLLTQKEFDALLEACRHPRDKAIISVLADSGMRIGALASCRIKNVEFNQYGAIIYISKTSKSKKTTPAKGIPITWSTGYLNQWLSIHPLKDDPEAPLWVTRDKNMEPLSYKSMRKTIADIGVKAGIKKRVNPHSFRHLAITHWILDGYNEQEIKHRAGWSKGSSQMFKIYGNFTDQEINDRIFEKCGLKTEDKRHVTLKKCPRCSNVLKPQDKFCSQCSLVLDHQALDEIGKYEARIPEILQLVMRSEEARRLLSKMGEK
ncbi:MAG: integrase/recombinase XerD [Methanolobus sp.]|nr:integrase/recombinase XerD [Methanolobus sp.]